MIEIAIETNAAQVGARMKDAPARISARVARRLSDIGAALVGYVVKEKLWNQLLHVRTGTLSRAVFWKLVLQDPDTVLVIGADAKKATYARIQEYGGTIRPVNAQNLAIPLDAARTDKGVARLSAREFMANPQSLGFERAFINRKHTAIMGATADGKYEPVFALKKSVTIPGRSYIGSSVADKREWILEQLRSAAVEGIEEK